MKGKDTKTPKSICPTCKKKLDGAFSPEGHTPDEEDITICIYCAEILTFGKDMLLEKITEKIKEEAISEGVWEQVIKMQNMIFERIKVEGKLN